MLHPRARRFRKPRQAGCNRCEREDERTAAGPWNSILELYSENCITHSDVSHRRVATGNPPRHPLSNSKCSWMMQVAISLVLSRRHYSAGPDLSDCRGGLFHGYDSPEYDLKDVRPFGAAMPP